jgi:hypothetical protein
MKGATHMAAKLFDLSEASAYTGVPEKFIVIQIKHNQGPAYIAPSPKRKFFTQDALDSWMATWKTAPAGDKFHSR